MDGFWYLAYARNLVQKKQNKTKLESVKTNERENHGLL